jgi:hypothetical protein
VKSPGLGLMFGGHPSSPTSGHQLRPNVWIIRFQPLSVIPALGDMRFSTSAIDGTRAKPGVDRPSLTLYSDTMYSYFEVILDFATELHVGGSAPEVV